MGCLLQFLLCWTTPPAGGLSPLLLLPGSIVLPLGGSSGFPESPVHSLNPVHTGAHSPLLNSCLPLGVPAASSRPLLTQRLRKGMKLADTFSC